MTVDELADLLEQARSEGRGGDRVVVRGYEAGLDDVVRVADADVLLDRRGESYYGPHDVVRAEGFGRARFTAGLGSEYPLADERVLWLVGSRDADGFLEGSVW